MMHMCLRQSTDRRIPGVRICYLVLISNLDVFRKRQENMWGNPVYTLYIRRIRMYI